MVKNGLLNYFKVYLGISLSVSGYKLVLVIIGAYVLVLYGPETDVAAFK